MFKNGTKSVWDEICQNFHVGRNLFGTKSVTPIFYSIYVPTNCVKKRLISHVFPTKDNHNFDNIVISSVIYSTNAFRPTLFVLGILFLRIHFILRFHDDGMILGIANVEIKDRMLWLKPDKVWRSF